MVQVISLLDAQDLTPQKTKNIKFDTKNVDFLELLMKDINEDTKLDKDSKDNKNLEILDLFDKELDLKDIESNKDIRFLMQNNFEFKENMVKEVKNILESKMKQQNILLSRSDIKEFKSIDNIKDLLKFADKKGLNIESIKVEIPKIKTKKELELKDNNVDKKVIKKQVDTKNILEKKQTIKINTNSKEPSKKEKPIVSLEKVLHSNHNKSTDKINKEKKQIIISNINKKEKILKNSKNLDNKLIRDNVVISQNTKINLQDKKVKSYKEQKEVIVPQNTKINLQDKKIILHKDIKELNIDTKNKSTKEINLAELLASNPKEEAKVKQISENSQNNINLSQTPINEIKVKSIQAKQTIESFKNNLDEAIKNYKPPVSKVDIELNPKNLGKVEVSIIQRGNNIQVHMNTDQSNVALFQTHQAEFRQALANIGFSNIDMSFNSNQDKERKQNQAKKAYKDNEIEDIADIEITADYKYA